MAYPIFAILDIFTFLIIGISIFLLVRQRGSYFKPMRVFLIVAYGLFSTTPVLGLLRQILESEAVAFWYTIIGVSVILLASLALTASAVAICKGGFPSVVMSYLGFKTKRALNVPLLLLTVYVVFLLLALGSLRPFALVSIMMPDGTYVISPLFQSWYILCLIILLLAFIAYPSRLMILRSRRVRSTLASRALRFMPISWVGAGTALLFFSGYLRYLHVEIASAGYLVSAILIAITANFFRKTTLLESLYEEPIEGKLSRRDDVRVFSERLGVSYSELLGRKMLLEYDPSRGYERVTKEFVQETLSKHQLALVVTRKGGPVHLALADEQGVRFLCLTHSVSYPEMGASDRENLLPLGDPSITLSAIDKILKANPNAKLSVVFDSLSDLIVSIGVEKTYTFLGSSLEILSSLDITALYLLNPTAHDPKIVSTISTLFATQIADDKEGLRMIKTLGTR